MLIIVWEKRHEGAWYIERRVNALYVLYGKITYTSVLEVLSCFTGPLGSGREGYIYHSPLAFAAYSGNHFRVHVSGIQVGRQSSL